MSQIESKQKKVIFISIACNLLVISFLLTYFQLFGKRIVVEPPKKITVVPKMDIDEGVTIDESMVTYAETYVKDYVSGAVCNPNKIINYKTKIKLAKDMQIMPYMLQPPEEQHKPGYFKVSIDWGTVANTVANQIQKNDYINVMLTIDKNSNSNKTLNKNGTYRVLSKRKILDLVNSSGVTKSIYSDEKTDFKTQYTIHEMNMQDYIKYKAAVLYAAKYGGTIEAVICDPTQPPEEETFDINLLDSTQKEILKQQLQKEGVNIEGTDSSKR